MIETFEPNDVRTWITLHRCRATPEKLRRAKLPGRFFRGEVQLVKHKNDAISKEWVPYVKFEDPASATFFKLANSEDFF